MGLRPGMLPSCAHAGPGLLCHSPAAAFRPEAALWPVGGPGQACGHPLRPPKPPAGPGGPVFSSAGWHPWRQHRCAVPWGNRAAGILCGRRRAPQRQRRHQGVQATAEGGGADGVSAAGQQAASEPPTADARASPSPTWKGLAARHQLRGDLARSPRGALPCRTHPTLAGRRGQAGGHL